MCVNNCLSRYDKNICDNNKMVVPEQCYFPSTMPAADDITARKSCKELLLSRKKDKSGVLRAYQACYPRRTGVRFTEGTISSTARLPTLVEFWVHCLWENKKKRG